MSDKAKNILLIALPSLVILLSLFTLLKSNSLGKGLSAYDFSTPEKALASQLEIDRSSDFLANAELRTLSNKKRFQERVNTLRVHEIIDFDDRKILLFQYERRGERRYAVSGYEQDRESGNWFRTSLSNFKIPEGSEMETKIEEWRKRD